jgi:pimeloyl-ACP methyl ester carboxylesterase
MAGGYSELRNERVGATNGVDYAYRDTTGPHDTVPLVLLQHFRGNLDNWDPALIDALATAQRVVTFDNTGVGGSAGTTSDTIEQMARDAIAFLAVLGFSQVDLLGFSIGSFVAQQITLVRPAIVRRLILASSAPQGEVGMRAGRPRSSARSAPRTPARKATWTCSSPGPPRAGKQASKRSGASTPGPRTGTRPRRGRPAMRSLTRSAPGDPRSRAAAAGDHHRHAGVRGQRRQRPDDPARYSYLLAGLIPHARVKIYPDSAHGF